MHIANSWGKLSIGITRGAVHEAHHASTGTRKALQTLRFDVYSLHIAIDISDISAARLDCAIVNNSSSATIAMYSTLKPDNGDSGKPLEDACGRQLQ